jgi:hypothetical protein
MTIEEQIVETLHALPPEQQAEVLDFAEFLRLRLRPVREAPAAGLIALPTLSGRVPSGWKDAIYADR